MGREVQAHARMDADHKATLIERASRHGLTLSDAFRVGAERYLDVLDHAAEAARDAGFTVTGKAGLPLGERDETWDAQAAKNSLQPAQFADAHFWRDPGGDPQNISSYKLGFAKNGDNGLHAVWAGVTAVAAVLQGGRGGVDIPQDEQTRIKGKVAAYYRAAADRYDDPSIKPPWEASVTDTATTTNDEPLAAADEAHTYKPLDAGQENSPCAICGKQEMADIHTSDDDEMSAGFHTRSIEEVVGAGIDLGNGLRLVYHAEPFVDVIAPEGEQGDSPPSAEMVSAGTPFRATLAQEGIPTDDGRQIEKGALEWRTLPLTLMAIIEDSHGGMPQTRTAVSGRIDTIERVETGEATADIIATGVFDTGEIGAEVARQVTEQMMRGVSVDLAVKESEEIIGDDAEGGVEDPFFGGNYLLVVKKGVILGATVCPFPAFGDVHIETITASGMLPRYAIPTMTFNSDDHVVRMTVVGQFAPADGPMMPPAPADDPDNDQDNDNDPLAGSTVHISVLVDELPTADQLAGVDPGEVAVTYKGDALNIAGLDLVDGDGQTVDVPLGKPLTASAAGMVPVLPPAAWFDYPQEALDQPDTLMPLHITKDGRVWGHVAAFNECHIGIPGKCQIAPHHFRNGDKGLCEVCGEPELHRDHSKGMYDYFHLGEIETQEGDLVRVGQLTISTGHAPGHMSAKQTQEHYDHTGSAVADLHLYEDNVGVMAAGALRPDVAAIKVRETRGSKPSGDWRLVRGRRELVGLLGTNVPGYTIRRIRIDDDGATEPVALVAAGFIDFEKAGTMPTCREGSISDLVARARMPLLMERAREARHPAPPADE